MNIGKITIQTDADFTPAGARKVRVVNLPRVGRYAAVKGVPAIRWYVKGAIYNTLPLTEENKELSYKWLLALD